MDIVGGMISQCNAEVLPLLCDLLAALGDSNPGVLMPLLLEICHEIRKMCSAGGTNSSTITLLCTLLFQTMMNHKWTAEAEKAIFECTNVLNGWNLYCVARNAARYGHNHIASKLFSAISQVSYTEQFYYWLKGLKQVFLAENVLNNIENDDIVERITSANAVIIHGSTSIKAATSQSNTQEFQIRYTERNKQMT